MFMCWLRGHEWVYVRPRPPHERKNPRELRKYGAYCSRCHTVLGEN